ncbi:MAG TPA: 50S ribosomal protein L25 [Vitreimonas sp.]|nr:50S ribosomal protein L25 [Vitreimonas sp.]
MEKLTFSAQLRTIAGKAVKTVRAQRLIPANVSVPGENSIMLALPQAAFLKLYEKAGDNGLIYLTIEGEKTARPVLVEDLQVDVVKNHPIHVVFRQVNLKEKLKAEIPVEVIGQSEVPESVLLTLHDVIEVEALPTDLPEKFEIDASTLTAIGQTITYADLKYDKTKVTLVLGEETEESPVVMLQEFKEQAEPVEEAPVAEGTEGEAAAPATEGTEEKTEEKAE